MPGFVSEVGAGPAFGVKPEPLGNVQPDELSDEGVIELRQAQITDDLVLTDVWTNAVASQGI